MNIEEKKPLLTVKNLKKKFRINKTFTVEAVNGVSFEIYPGETYGLVGESGSGKSTIARTLIRLYKPTEGEIFFDGHDISGKLNKVETDYLRTNMQMIFQDPISSLNPRRKVMDIIAQGLDIHHQCDDRAKREQKVYEMLNRVGLASEHATRYPHQFSGGQRQRIGIARALIVNPKLIIADEAISALDVSIQAQVVNLMQDIQKETNTAYLFIAHDLAMIRYISDRVGVLHMGYLVETGTTEEIFNNPIHPYTRSLLSSIPFPNPVVEKVRMVKDYDEQLEGINYELGKNQLVSGTHYVLATDEELKRWVERAGKEGLLDIRNTKFASQINIDQRELDKKTDEDKDSGKQKKSKIETFEQMVEETLTEISKGDLLKERLIEEEIEKEETPFDEVIEVERK